MRLHSPRDDPLGEVARVVLQRLDTARLEHLDVVVVDRCCFGEDFLRRHGGEQVGLSDPAAHSSRNTVRFWRRCVTSSRQQAFGRDTGCRRGCVGRGEVSRRIGHVISRLTLALRRARVANGDISLRVTPDTGEVSLSVDANAG